MRLTIINGVKCNVQLAAQWLVWREEAGNLWRHRLNMVIRKYIINDSSTMAFKLASIQMAGYGSASYGWPSAGNLCCHILIMLKMAIL